MSIDGIYWADAPTGKRLVPEGPARPKNWWADVPGLRDADEDSITVARRWFSEASFDDFEIERQDWVDKGSGNRYRKVAFHPLLSPDPSDTGVSLFIVYGESMMFLRPVGSAGTVTRVEVGSVGGMPATGKERL